MLASCATWNRHSEPGPKGERREGAAFREPGAATFLGLLDVGLQSVTQCLCISLHIRLYKEPGHIVQTS